MKKEDPCSPLPEAGARFMGTAVAPLAWDSGLATICRIKGRRRCLTSSKGGLRVTVSIASPLTTLLHHTEIL
jgi:hypothetical protein